MNSMKWKIYGQKFQIFMNEWEIGKRHWFFSDYLSFSSETQDQKVAFVCLYEQYAFSYLDGIFYVAYFVKRN